MTDKILLCDDERDSIAAWQQKLEAVLKSDARFSVGTSTKFLEDADELEARRVAARKPGTRQPQKCLFDDVAVLIVDYDLLHLDKNRYLTGETLAYLARCYSSCELVIVLNQFGQNSFDLTLRGHPESFGDLNVGSEQIANPSLWGQEYKGFSPWAWTPIPELLKRQRSRVASLAGSGLDEPVAHVLKLTDQDTMSLSRSAREFLENGGKTTRDVTFRDLCQPNAAILRPKDRLADDIAIARVAAARVARWCDDWLLTAQDLVVDAPHMVLRYPSLAFTDSVNFESLNKTAERRSGLHWKPAAEHMAAFEFPASAWLSRPVWKGRALAGNQSLREVRDPWSAPPADFVFCEDVSRFAPREAARGFIADVESPHVARFVSDPDSDWFADIRTELARIDYQPRVRLSQRL